MATQPYQFTDAQIDQVIFYLGYPPRGLGQVVFPYPYIMRQYLALMYFLTQDCGPSQAQQIITILASCTTLWTAIQTASGNLATESAGPWVHNKREVRDRINLYNYYRKQLSIAVGIPLYGGDTGGSSRQIVV